VTGEATIISDEGMYGPNRGLRRSARSGGGLFLRISRRRKTSYGGFE
jgi:hypothetical protein